MNPKKYALAVAAAFVCMMATGFVVHGLLLAEDYKGLGAMMRPEQDQVAHFPFNLLRMSPSHWAWCGSTPKAWRPSPGSARACASASRCG